MLDFQLYPLFGLLKWGKNPFNGLHFNAYVENIRKEVRGVFDHERSPSGGVWGHERSAANLGPVFLVKIG